MFQTTTYMTEGAPANQTEICFNRRRSCRGKSSDHRMAVDATAVPHILLLHMFFAKVDNILNGAISSENPIRDFNVKLILDGHDDFHDI